jgi:two-component system phosphate regulon sensor histidine kinase PhoR
MLSSAKKADYAVGNDLLTKILDATKEGVVVVARGLRVVAANRSAEQAFRAVSGSLVGRGLDHLVQDDAVLTAFVRGCAKLETSDLHLKLGPKGNRRRYDVHVAPLDIEGVPHAIGFFYDVTQVHRLENIRQAFLSNISHELRTPLTSILAFVETLENGGLEDTENNRHFLNVIQRNGERMRDLIADILELSQIEAGSVSIELKKVPLWRHVEEIMTNLSSMAAEREIVLENKTEAGSVVSADPKRLGQMLTNLIDNAIRFNRRGGSVTISDELLNDRHMIHVADTGEGMEQKELQRVFERFYRVDRSRTRDVGGTGLGLAIVKHLARLHGGEVSVESNLGVGTTFTIDIPADQP